MQTFVLIQPRTSPPKICKNVYKRLQNLPTFIRTWAGAASSGVTSQRYTGRGTKARLKKEETSAPVGGSFFFDARIEDIKKPK